MIEIRNAGELGDVARKWISEVFADGFGAELSYFAGGGGRFRGWGRTPAPSAEDKRRLATALEHMFVPEQFYLALVDGEPAGIATCGDGTELAVRHSWRELVGHLGLVKGTVATVVFRHEFQKLPTDPAPGRAFVGFVATAERFRGRGIATAIMEHLLAQPHYDEYVLEDIADSNTAAIRLYQKLGYQEFKRVRVRHTKQAGINHYISMRLVQH